VQETAARVLIIDDDPDLARLVSRPLQRAGIEARCYESGEEGLAALEAEAFDVVVCDVCMPGLDGVEVCRRVRDNHRGLPVVLMTAYASFTVVSGAMRAGAVDILLKPFGADVMRAAIEEALSRSRARRSRRATADRVDVSPPPEDLVGSSPAWRRIVAEAQAIAGSTANVLLVGESGTGKEMLARAIHRMGPRRDAPFVALSCAAIPAGLLESELFGHEKGAFTGADRSRDGLVVSADGGTLFLDEIGLLPPALQPKLLRVLQERIVRPVGGAEERPVDVRVLAATNVDLHREVLHGRFRSDLLYRLDVLRLDLPALRERRDDALELAEHFLREVTAQTGRQLEGLSPGARAQIARYPWPGNARELRNCIESAAALASGPTLDLGDLPPAIRDWEATALVDPDPSTLEAAERQHVERVLRACDGNRKRAAAALGIGRSSLYRKLRKYGLE